MAGGFSDALELALLDHVFGDTPYTAPATLYVALSLSPFDRAATGTACDEVPTAGTAYARIALTNNTTNFPNAAGSNPSFKSIGVDVTFPTATADYGTVLSYYLIDAATNGTIVGGGDAVTPYPIASGAIPVIQANTANITLL